jgi:hypothetical protein
MTPDERKRMNELCVGIQEEKDYGKFAAMLREMTTLIERKEQRRFPDEPKVVWTRNKPSVSMPARANRLLPSIDGPDKKVEITIPAADDLFLGNTNREQAIGSGWAPRFTCVRCRVDNDG